MQSTSSAFTTAEADIAPEYKTQVLLRRNPEALEWNLARTGIGTSGVGPMQLEDAIVTSSGTLLRLLVPLNGLVLYISRTPAGAELPATAAYQNFTQVGVSRQIGTRAGIAITGSEIRIFYVAQDYSISCVTSTNDGVSWTGQQTILPYTSGPEGGTLQMALVPSNALTFFGVRRQMVQRAGITNEYLIVYAYYWNGSSWQVVPHPRKMPRARSVVNTASTNWRAEFQASAATNPNGESVLVVLDDIAGRPASSIFVGGYWSDYFPVEAIDFAEPEREDLSGIRLTWVVDKFVLSGMRAAMDSDFYSTKQSYLYYSPNGRQWSEAYYVAEAASIGDAVPLLFSSNMVMAGASQLHAAPPTTIFGSQTPIAQETDITASVISMNVDEPEDRKAAAQATVSLDNRWGQYTEHPLLKPNSELEIRAGYTGTELITLFQGRISAPPLAATPEDSTVELRATDYLHNFTQGEADRLIEYPSPPRRVILFEDEADLQQMGSPDGKFEWVSEDGLSFARSTKKGPNTLSLSAGMIGRFAFSAKVRMNNPAVGEFALPGSAHTSAQGYLMWDADTTFRNFYCVRFGRETVDFELYRVENGHGTLLARSVTVPFGTPPFAVNSWMIMDVLREEQRMIVTVRHYSPFAEHENAWLLFDYTDPVPIQSTGTVAVRCRQIDEKSGQEGETPSANALHTMSVDDIRIYGQAYQTSTDEFVYGLSLMRGFTNVQTEYRMNQNLANLPGWTRHGNASKWVTDGLGGVVVVNSTPAEKILARSPIYVERYGMFDVYGQIGNGSNVTDFIGVAVGINQPGSNYTTLSIQKPPYDPSFPWVSNVGVQVIENNIVVKTQWKTVPFNIWSGSGMWMRTVFEHPWITLYVGGYHVATFYEPRMAVSGYIGLSPGFNGIGSTRYYQMVVPWLDNGNMPIIMPGDTLDAPLFDLIEAKNGWISAAGRTLRVGALVPTGAQDYAGNNVWLSGGHEPVQDFLPTHYRVLSTTPEGVEIAATVNSPTLLRSYGRAIFKSEKVEGLRNEWECREHAWQKLLELYRKSETRSWECHPRLRWQRNDVIWVENSLDDTQALMFVSGSERTFERELDSPTWRASMQARLEFRSEAVLERAAIYPPG